MLPFWKQLFQESLKEPQNYSMKVIWVNNFCASILVTFNLFLTASHFFLISAQTKTLCLSARLQNPVPFFNSWVRANVLRVIAGTGICKLVTRSFVVGSELESAKICRFRISTPSPKFDGIKFLAEYVHRALLTVFFVANFLQYG